MRSALLGFILGTAVTLAYQALSNVNCITKYAQRDNNLFFVDGSIYELNKLSDTAAGKQQNK